MPRGGARPNSGPAKGTKYAPTISKELAREALRVVVQRHMDRMLRSQIANAIGIGHLYTRDKSGKFNKIESEAEVDRLMAEGAEGSDYWIFTKDPSVQAFTDLVNRAHDKPKEQPQEIDVRGTLEVIDRRLEDARKRVAAR
jgi:hypothetical protein